MMKQVGREKYSHDSYPQKEIPLEFSGLLFDLRLPSFQSGGKSSLLFGCHGNQLICRRRGSRRRLVGPEHCTPKQSARNDAEDDNEHHG
jgi:hypothetical protein